MNLRVMTCETGFIICALLFQIEAASAQVAGNASTVSSMAAEAAASGETLTADTNRPNNSTFVLGQEVQVTFSAGGLAPFSSAKLFVQVTNEYYNLVSVPEAIELVADASGKASATYAAPAAAYGYYRVAGMLADGTTIASLGTRPSGFVSYSVVPDPSTRVNYGDAGSRFGMQGGFSPTQGNVIQDLGVRYLLDGPGWASLEPAAAGQFRQDIATASAKGTLSPALSHQPALRPDAQATWAAYAVPVVLNAKLPTWAIAPGTTGTICTTMGALNAAGVAEFPVFAKEYAAQVAAAYPNQTSHYYQITWEPEKGWCFNGTTAQLVQFYRLSYAAIHAADPKAVVMGPTLFPEDTMPLTGLWAAGLGNYIDAVSMHPYVAFPPETHGLVTNIRTQMKMAQDAKGTAVPFLGTEHGYTSASIGELNEALGNIRSTIILLGEGFTLDFAFYVADYWDSNAGETNNTYGYYWNLDPKLPFGTDKISPKPAVPAFAAMTLLLDGSTSAGPVADLGGTQMGYRFIQDGTTVLALWDYATNGSKAAVTTRAGTVKVCDWMGNCTTRTSSGTLKLKLKSAPTYIIGTNL
jgi:hypothetical protein